MPVPQPLKRKYTTMAVNWETYDRLDKLRISPSESFNDVIKRILDNYAREHRV